MKKKKGLTEREKAQGNRIIDAWRAVKTINQHTDKRLAGAGPLSETLIFCRKWIQPVAMDLYGNAIINLESGYKDEQIKQVLDAEVRRVLGKSAENQLDFRFHRITGDGMEIIMAYAVEHPHGWTWRERDRQICGQIYASLRSLDVLIDDIERACRTGLEFLRHDYPEACRDVRLMTDDERKERVEWIKSLTPEYWSEGEHRPGRYPQLSVEREAWRRRYRIETKAEDDHCRLVTSWENYTEKVRREGRRRTEVEADAIRWAERVAPDFVETIRTQIDKLDRVNNAKEEVDQQ
jgi:hypothetical protein